MVNPPYIYLKRDGSNQNTNIDFQGYSVSANTYSGSTLGNHLLGKGARQAASGTHRHKLSGLADVSWTSDNSFLNSGLRWNGISWVAVSGGGGGGVDTSNTLTLADASGIASDVAIQHDGSAGTLYLVDIPQNILKSGSEYWNSYLSGQRVKDTFDKTNYIISSSAISRFAGSSNLIGRYHPSGYVISGEQYSRAYISTSTGVFALTNHSHTEFGLWSGALGYLGMSGSYNTHRQDSSIHFTQTSLDGIYHPSGYVLSGSKYSQAYISTSTGVFALANHSHDESQAWSGSSEYIAMSGSYGSHRQDSTIHFTLQSIQDDFPGSSNVNRSLIDSISSNLDTRLDAHDTDIVALYNTSSAHDSRLDSLELQQPASWSGASEYIAMSGSYGTHRQDTTIHFTQDSLDSIYHQSGLVISGAEYSKAYASAQIALYSETYSNESDLTAELNDNYPGSSNVNWTKIIAISSGFDGRLDALESQQPLSWSGASDFYSFSSNTKQDILDLFNTSSAHKSRLDSLESQSLLSWSGAQGYWSVSSTVSTLNTWYGNSSQKLSNAYQSAQIALYEEVYSNESDLTSALDDNYHPSGYVISGSEYSQAYASAQIALYEETYSSEDDLTNALNDNYYPSGLGKDVSGAVHYNSLHSSNSDIHVKPTTHAVFASVSSTAGISGSWMAPLYESLTDAGAAISRPGQIIRTSGNSDGTWVWISIYGGSSYNWMQLTYLSN